MLLENLGKEMFLVRLHPFNGRQPKDDRPLTSYSGIARVFLSSVVLSVRLGEDSCVTCGRDFPVTISSDLVAFAFFCGIICDHNFAI